MRSPTANGGTQFSLNTASHILCQSSTCRGCNSAYPNQSEAVPNYHLHCGKSNSTETAQSLCTSTLNFWVPLTDSFWPRKTLGRLRRSFLIMSSHVHHDRDLKYRICSALLRTTKHKPDGASRALDVICCEAHSRSSELTIATSKLKSFSFKVLQTLVREMVLSLRNKYFKIQIST